jgi:predicted choloylglycine hydrolase
MSIVQHKHLLYPCLTDNTLQVIASFAAWVRDMDGHKEAGATVEPSQFYDRISIPMRVAQDLIDVCP